MYLNNSYNYYSNLEINLEKIEKYIQTLQKEIYQASKVCATDIVNKYQNDFSIHQDLYWVIIKKIILVLKKKISYTYTYYKKLLIVIYFIIQNNDKTKYYGLQLIKNQITQYFLFLLLKPEWEAKYENFAYIYQSYEYIKVIKDHIIVLFDTYHSCKNIYSLKIGTQLNCKHINKQKLTQKINKSYYISNTINIWLSYQNCINQNILLKYFIQSVNYENNLYKLLNTVMFTGLEWNIYINLKMPSIYLKILINKKQDYLFFISVSLIIDIILKSIANFLHLININLKSMKCHIYKYTNHSIVLDDINLIIQDKTKFIVKINQQSIKSVCRFIKHKLYHRNQFGYWRANNYLNSAQAIFFIRALLSKWYKFYHDVIASEELIVINNKVDRIFYAWQKKK